MISEARAYLDKESNEERIHFYRAILISLEAFQNYVERYELFARDMATKESDSKRAGHLEKLADITATCLQSVSENFHEALQSVWFLFAFLHLESNASSFSPG